MQKSLRFFLCLLLALSSVSAFAAKSKTTEPEDWKGPADPYNINFTAETGMAIWDGTVGLGVLGGFGVKVIKEGWIPDITNSVWAEFQAGPMILTNGSSPVAFHAHLRWDFKKDELWTLFAIGGLGGNVLSNFFTTHFELFPRFGVGGFYKIAPNVRLRAEASPDFIVGGVDFPF